jgi:hypothetical protein
MCSSSKLLNPASMLPGADKAIINPTSIITNSSDRMLNPAGSLLSTKKDAPAPAASAGPAREVSILNQASRRGTLLGG